MYPSLAVFAVLAGVCLFAFARRMAKNRTAAVSIQIMGIALIVIGGAMLYGVFSGKVVLPLS